MVFEPPGLTVEGAYDSTPVNRFQQKMEKSFSPLHTKVSSSKIFLYPLQIYVESAGLLKKSNLVLKFWLEVSKCCKD